MAQATTMNSFAQASLPPTSLIICSRNRPKLLLETVESVLQGDEVPTELVIIDQSDVSHPTLASLKTDRPCEIRYLWTHSVGLSRARNAGIAAAQRAIVAFIDDDMFVTPTWFGSLISALLNGGECAVVTGKVLPTAAEVPGGFAPSCMVREAPAVYEGRIGADVLAGGHMATYRSILDTMAGFDERLGPGAEFGAAEDNDLGFRLLEAGYRIIYVANATLYHRAWRTTRDRISLGWNYGRGQGAYYAKHLSRRDRYMLRRMVWDIMYYTLLFARQVWRKPVGACGDAVYILALACGAIEWLLTQQRTR